MRIVSTTVNQGNRRAYAAVTNRPWPAWRATLRMMIMTFSFSSCDVWAYAGSFGSIWVTGPPSSLRSFPALKLAVT
jgi:hypothetical protein